MYRQHTGSESRNEVTVLTTRVRSEGTSKIQDRLSNAINDIVNNEDIDNADGGGYKDGFEDGKTIFSSSSVLHCCIALRFF